MHTFRVHSLPLSQVVSLPFLLHSSKLCAQPWSITWDWTWEQLPMSMPLRKSSRCTTKLVWPSLRHNWLLYHHFTYNFCRPVTSLHVTTEICSCDSLVNGHCSQQVSLNQPLERLVRGSCTSWCVSRNHVYRNQLGTFSKCSLCLPPGCAALLCLANRVSAAGRGGSQEQPASSGQVWHFPKVAWSSNELLLFYIYKITQFSKLQTK